MLFLWNETRRSLPCDCHCETNIDQRYHITPIEIILYIWFAAFAYDELSEFIDAGSIFYSVDIWNGCDLVIIFIGAAFIATSKIDAVSAVEGNL
jgi:hypothetical protein